MAGQSPLAAHQANPAELQQRIVAERAGRPFLLLRDGDGVQQILALATDRVSVGRGESNDVALTWDAEVSRLHAELERIAGQWTISDDGLSRNGTYVGGARISGRVRLRDGDLLQLGRTIVAFCDPAAESTQDHTRAGEPPPELTAAQRRLLIALARPFKHGGIAAPATNQQIGAELHLSVDAIKAQLRALYAHIGIDDLPQQQKRQRLVAVALERGLISVRDL